MKTIIRNIFIACALLLLFCTYPSLAQENKGSKYVSIDFDNVDINVVIKTISELTGKNFVVDSRVKGKVTIISPTKVSVQDAYKVFESVLQINGFSTVKAGKAIKIIPTPKARADNIDTSMIIGQSKELKSFDDKLVTRIIPLKYANSDELRKLFSPLITKDNIMLSYSDTNILIITASLSSINRLLKIIESIDLPRIGRKISVVPIKYADAKKLSQNLSSIFSAKTKGMNKRRDANLMVNFVADERTNSIIFLASSIEAQRVNDLIKILDQQVPKGEEKIKVYYLEHASAEELVKVLLEVPSKTSKKANREGQKKMPILSSDVKIMADKATNSIIIMADKEDYPVLEQLIDKLDIPRAMVYIECLLMEVNVSSGLSVGTEWRAPISFDNDTKAVFGGFGATSGKGLSNLGNIASTGMLNSGVSVGVLGKNITIGDVTFPGIQAVINAYQNDTDVNILATPQILTMENEEASIKVGKNVPYQTRSAAEGVTDTYSSYEYKDVGITLKITPQISEDRLVKLKVYQELTKLDSVNEAGVDRPTTLKRQIDTTIIVEDSNSVVIGGLIDETLTKSEYKTPCLGDVPLLGWAFKSVSKGEDNTNLYIFLTPKVIKNPLEAQKIYLEKGGAIQSKKRITIDKGEVKLH